jgi:hypothetical protein
MRVSTTSGSLRVTMTIGFFWGVGIPIPLQKGTAVSRRLGGSHEIMRPRVYQMAIAKTKCCFIC